MIRIQELSKNLPANRTKVLIEFDEIVPHDEFTSVAGACSPLQFITRLHNIDIMINYHTNVMVADTRFYVTLGKCRESYYMEDHSDTLYKPTTFVTCEVTKEDYDQFVLFRRNPLKYLNIQEEILKPRRVVRNPIMELEV